MTLLQATTTDRTVEIIKAIGSIWPLLLVIILTTIFFIYRKRILNIKVNRTSVKTPIAEFQFETIEKTESNADEALTPNNKKEEIQTEEILEIQQEENTVEEAKELTYWDLYVSTKEKDFSDAERILKELQDNMSEDEKKFEAELIYLYWKFRYGGVNSLEDLKQKGDAAPSNSMKIKSFQYLAESYEFTQNFSLAIEYYEKSLNLETDIDSKTSVISKLAKCYQTVGRKDAAIALLYTTIKSTDNNNALAKLYSALSDYFSKEGDTTSKLLAQEMAIAHNPTDSDTLFNIAYEYSGDKVRMDVMAVLHYNSLLKFNSKNSSAMNNLGVNYNKVGLKGLSVGQYKKAVELNETLASANLAQKFISEGFYEEAKEILQIAKNQKIVHENVWFYLNDIAKKEKEETEKQTQIISSANSFQIFLRDFAVKYFLNIKEGSSIDGNWYISNELVKITNLPNPDYYEFNFKLEALNYSLILPLGKNDVVIGSGKSTPTYGSTNNDLRVYAYMNLTKTVLHIFFYDSKEDKGKIIEVVKRDE